MSGLIVYLPKCPSADRQVLIDRGLGGLLDPAVDPVFGAATRGPDGGSGIMAVFCGWHVLPPPAFNAEAQEWIEAPPQGELPRGRYWLGYNRSAKPTAHDLQRAKLIHGEPVLLADGSSWVIPCSDHAPRRLTRSTETGGQVEVIKDEYVKWVEWCNDIYSEVISANWNVGDGDGFSVTVRNGIEFAALTLSKNYRVNIDAIDLLKLIDKEHITPIALAASGITTLAEAIRQKKNSVA